MGRGEGASRRNPLADEDDRDRDHSTYSAGAYTHCERALPWRNGGGVSRGGQQQWYRPAAPPAGSCRRHGIYREVEGG